MNPFEIEKVWDKLNTIIWNPTAKAAMTWHYTISWEKR